MKRILNIYPSQITVTIGEQVLFSMSQGQTKEILYKDQEENRWVKTNVQIDLLSKLLLCVDVEGLDWESPINELEDPTLIKFL